MTGHSTDLVDAGKAFEFLQDDSKRLNDRFDQTFATIEDDDAFSVTATLCIASDTTVGAFKEAYRRVEQILREEIEKKERETGLLFVYEGMSIAACKDDVHSVRYIVEGRMLKCRSLKKKVLIRAITDYIEKVGVV